MGCKVREVDGVDGQARPPRAVHLESKPMSYAIRYSNTNFDFWSCSKSHSLTIMVPRPSAYVSMLLHLRIATDHVKCFVDTKTHTLVAHSSLWVDITFNQASNMALTFISFVQMDFVAARSKMLRKIILLKVKLLVLSSITSTTTTCTVAVCL